MKTLLTCLLLFGFTVPLLAADGAGELLERISAKRGIAVVVGGDPDLVSRLAAESEWTWFVQVEERDEANRIRESAERAKVLGTKVFVAEENGGHIHLADNVADAVFVLEDASVGDEEVLRALRPRASAWIGGRVLTKPVPEGYDDWSHPFHRADNNPQSDDKFVQGRFRTQFIGGPKFSPMPEQTVIGGGRIYKAMGHIAHKANQNEHLNTLLCINAFNGTILWKRPLTEGFMIHRNTMVATEDALYLGGPEACEVIDGETGEVRERILVPEGMGDGPTWKWMAIEDGVLYALVGNREVLVETQKSMRRGLGHWPWGMWKGHEYADPNTSFGFGRTLIAYDLSDQKVLWNTSEKEFLDARALVMKGDQIVAYAPEKFLVALDRKTGGLRWRSKNADLLAAIGPNGRAQHYITGYATTSYMKCTDDFLFFSGPQRERLVAASMKDGSLAWTYEETGNLQLVLRKDAIYAAGEQNTIGLKLDYQTGDVLAEFPARRACTRATGCVDSIFFRAHGGTVRVLTEQNTAQHIAPMRPPCQDGVLISNGHLYWGPWMCGCQLSLYGNIGLAPQSLPGKEKIAPDPDELYEKALRVYSENAVVPKLTVEKGDWTRYEGDEARSKVSRTGIPQGIEKKWSVQVTENGELPTAPVTAGGFVFVADRAGIVRAYDAATGELSWKSYTAGPVYYPPAISDDRLFVGSADGKVYAFSAGTGELLWTFRVGEPEQLIPVFGKLVSSWPVAGGVVVRDGTVYAAAGITHYDGTYVVALDARSGERKAQNTTSGILSSEVDSGISMQGNLTIVDGELRFLGGGVYETARYDLETLACLNQPKVQVTSEFRTAFYPYYPEYNRYVSLEHKCEDGRTLNYDSNYEGLYFNNLALQEPPGEWEARPHKDAAGEFIRMQSRRRKDAPAPPRNVWRDERDLRFNSLVVAEPVLLYAGHPDEKEDAASLGVLRIEDGTELWSETLPAVAVKGGLAIDARQRVFVSLENGELCCYSATAP